jgi:hypothetical protein
VHPATQPYTAPKRLLLAHVCGVCWRPRPKSQEDWAKAAAKAARLTVMQRAKGRKRAAL